MVLLTGKVKSLSESQFDFAFPFHEGLAAICVGCKEDPEGEYHSVKGGTWGYINRRGKIVIPAQFEEAGDFENGKAEVKFNSKRVFIDKRGRIIKGSISDMEKEGKQSIGSARMETDGTIVLQLRAESSGGTIGDALFSDIRLITRNTIKCCSILGDWRKGKKSLSRHGKARNNVLNV